jgi:hypothetical protein
LDKRIARDGHGSNHVANKSGLLVKGNRFFNGGAKQKKMKSKKEAKEERK